MHNCDKGFTLLELMIVVALIMILASIALPAYKDYTIRARVSELVVLADNAKTTITESIINNAGALPNDPCSGVTTAIPPGSKNAQHMTCANANGAVSVTGTALTAGTTLTFTPDVVASAAVGVMWTCAGSGSSAKYYPPECR